MSPNQFQLLMDEVRALGSRLRRVELQVAGLIGGCLLAGALLGAGVIKL